MRKVDDGKKEKRKEKKEKKREKNGVFSGHYVIASCLPPERRPLERRTLVPIAQQIGLHSVCCTTQGHTTL